MSIASVGYGAIGTGFNGLAVVPGGLGVGFVTVGTKLLDLSAWLRAQGEFFKMASKGYRMLDEQKLSLSAIKKSAADNRVGFNEALVAAVGDAAAVAAVDPANDSTVKQEETVDDTAVVVAEDPAGGVGTKTATVVVADDDDIVVENHKGAVVAAASLV